MMLEEDEEEEEEEEEALVQRRAQVPRGKCKRKPCSLTLSQRFLSEPLLPTARQKSYKHQELQTVALLER